MDNAYECGYCPAVFSTYEDRMNHYYDDCPARDESIDEMRLNHLDQVEKEVFEDI